MSPADDVTDFIVTLLLEKLLPLRPIDEEGRVADALIASGFEMMVDRLGTLAACDALSMMMRAALRGQIVPAPRERAR
jgi:hypothetical protein